MTAQVRLVVVKIDMRRATGHEQIDDMLRLGCEMQGREFSVRPQRRIAGVLAGAAAKS